MVWHDLKPSKILTRESFQNALAVQMALGGSTNAVVHIIALAQRAGIDLTLDHLQKAADSVPVLCNLFPSGQGLMEDFYYAGGLPALMQEIKAHLHLDALTVTGLSLRQNIAHAKVLDSNIIRPFNQPVSPRAALAVVRGNLAPNGAVLKPSAASERLLEHRGKALVFDNQGQLLAAMEDENLDCDENTVLVLRNAGPVGAPGMPEWGNLPIPKKLLKLGVRDMLRLSDSRMSGTHYGTCVLHISPESAVGGPLALLKTGDEIALSCTDGTLEMLVDAAELERRRKAWQAPVSPYQRGYTSLYQQHVTQAHLGCDFDFLSGTQPTPEPDIY
jgi:dihydroxy-acid dehydratase